MNECEKIFESHNNNRLSNYIDEINLNNPHVMS